MNKKTIIVLFLLSLAILIGIPESFAYPQYGSSCSDCHVINAAQNGLGNEMGISAADRNKNADLTQENAQTGDSPRQMMNPMRYTLGVIGTGLVVISQFYSLRKRGR
ncbi:Uncharacterised protein [uncultured archaeon]|nr:Uncharacterised protein [uncultured archaeon]